MKTKTIEEFLSDLCSLDIKLWVEDNRLRCRVPKDVLTSTIKQELAERKEDIIAFIRNNNVALFADKHPILPVPRQGNLPLSFAQQRLWFVEQFTQVSQVYDVPSISCLRGSLNIAALKCAINEIVRRHEILRTSFTSVEGQPVQIIHPTLSLSLPVVDLQGLAQVERDIEIQRLINNVEASQLFNLTEVPLLWCFLIKSSEEEHVLLFLIHHIITDGWSSGIINHELTTLYEAFSQNQPSPLPELPIQYADFAIWQRQYLQGKVLDNLLTYWKQKLSRDLPVLQLPTDYPRPAIQSFSGKRKSFFLSEDLTRALKALSRNEDVTLFMTLLAAFKTLLHRYSGQDDILVGSPIANRNQNNTEELIGFFVNTLVLHTNFNGDPSFQELLKRIRETTLGAYAHQDIPFELLVEQLQIQRNLSYTPLFQVMFVLHNAPIPALEMAGLIFEPVVNGKNRNVMFDLILHITETEDGINGALDYNTDLSEESSIQTMVSHLQTLLEGIVANPQQRLSELPLLTESEQEQLLHEWNNTEVEYPLLCIHELFEAQVEKTPNAIAVVFEEQQLTYRQLNQWANQLGHYLQSLEVGSGVLVGICFEPSLEQVVSLLAVLKANGVYVPLDPNYPQERLSFMLENSNVRTLLTKESLTEKISSQNAHIVCLDRDRDAIGRESAGNLNLQTAPDDLAYAIYTSGSTGKPKAVLGKVRGIINRLHWMWETLPFAASEVCIQKTSINFVDHVAEIFSPLLKGVPLVVVPDNIRGDVPRLMSLLRDKKITRIVVVPSLLKAILDTTPQQLTKLQYLKYVFCSGEALPLKLASLFHQKLSSARLFNLYGSSEVAADVTCYEVNFWETRQRILQYFKLNNVRDITDNKFTENYYKKISQEVLPYTIPIGKPISNTRIYILDKYGSLLPPGVTGELYVGGDGLAQGYLNLPELTQEKFLSNPFTKNNDKTQTTAEARLYRTGDLARWLPDGNIEFIGRIDHQTKVRGFRIELGEIEAVVSQHPAVREAIVLVREDKVDFQRIVAYVIAQKEQTLTITELREFLESKLPNYMVPGVFVTLEKLPLTPNGKIDRKALPAPELTQISSSDIISGSTPIENLLAGIWAEILGIEKVGIYNNFFELGGHSLIATRVISQIRQVFQVELPLRSLFEKPTIAGLAKEIEKAIKLDSAVEATSIERTPRLQQLPLSFAQQRLWFLAQLEPDNPLYNISAAVKLQGKLNSNALEQSFNEIVCRHEALRTNFQTIEGQAVAVISSEKPLKLSILDISCLNTFEQEEAVKQNAIQEAQQPFDISNDHLLRVKILCLSQQEHIVLLTMHHIVSDGWSVGVLVEEFSSLYSSFSKGETICEAELPIQYVDFAAWQRQWLQGEVLEAQISYWLKQLGNAPFVLELPTDHPRPAIQTYRGANYSFKLSEELSTALNKLSQQQGTTLFMTLLAGFQILLWRYTAVEDIVVGSPIANRNRAEIEGLIGFFVNTLVLRTNLGGNPSFEELLKRVREVALGAYAHQDLPFELLVEQLQPQRDLSHSPLFQVMFVLQNAPMSALELPDLTLTPLENYGITSKFDLTLQMTETEEGLEGNLEYNTDLFEEDTIQRMVGHLQMLLKKIVMNPQQRLSELPLLTEPEQHQLLVKWNDTEVEYSQQQCIHELFEAQVEKTPDAIAVAFEDQQLTYKELNAKTNQLAYHLRTLGVKPEVLVGICVERSLDMVIGLLAILKAGGAYVPLDPNYPQERLTYMLEDSQPDVLLTQQYLLESLPSRKAQVICIDSDWKQIASERTENPASNITIDNLAYVIYTSGSTGKPKGAMNTHSGICNRLLWMQDTYQLTSADAVLQKTPFSFDVSVWEFFWTLITGARLVVAQPDGHRDPNYLVNLIRQQRVTTLHFVPSMLQVFLEAEGLEKCQSLVRVIASGEALPAQLQRRFFNRLNAQLHNLYGPTEAAVDVTFWQCKKDKLSNQNTVPIGQPITNIQIYIVDKYFNPVPMGVTGEVYIGGVGVARGYLNRSDLSAQKFIPNPFSGKATRLYRSGDLARYLPSGDIEYIGRIDNQVKVRGFRIELGEIEAVISQYPAVRETAVVVREDSVNSQRIIAYIVAQTEQTVVISELREFLESKLPNYMVPAAFVTLETLPLTPNGKVDRKALPAPHTLRPELEETYVAPQTTVEKQLATIWKEILGLEKIGIHDNFFELGGDSILSLQIVSKANQAGLYLIPKQIFQYQTIAQLVTVIGTTEKIQAEQGVLTGTLELIPIQQWFFEQNQPQAHHWNQAVFLENKQNIDPTVLEKVIESLLKHHDVLRLQFKQTEFSTQALIVSPDNTIPLTYLDLSSLPEDKQATAIEVAANKLQASLNLSQGPIFQVAHFKLGDNQPNRLLWIIHHLSVDGVSWRVLIEDFQTAYQQITQGEAIKLPPKTTSYKQWSSRIQEYAQSSELLSELDFWLATQSKSFSPIPRDFPDGNNIEETTSTVSVSLSVEETQSLLQQVPAAYRTKINDVLLTALTLTFNQWTGENSLLLDLEGHGREEIFEDVDLSRTVGWFTTIFPVHLNLENAKDLGEALKLIKEQLRAIPNRGIGYGLLRYLRQDKEIIEQFSLSKAEVLFNYLGQFDQLLPESSLFSFTQESSGSTKSLQNKRTHLLEINCGIYQKTLEISWSYSNKLHRRTTIEELAQNFIKRLRSLIAHCQSPDAGGFTPSDFVEFKQSQWDQTDLDVITAAMGDV